MWVLVVLRSSRLKTGAFMPSPICWSNSIFSFHINFTSFHTQHWIRVLFHILTNIFVSFCFDISYCDSVNMESQSIFKSYFIILFWGQNFINLRCPGTCWITKWSWDSGPQASSYQVLVLQLCRTMICRIRDQTKSSLY